jgi:hypothetical protein
MTSLEFPFPKSQTPPNQRPHIHNETSNEKPYNQTPPNQRPHIHNETSKGKPLAPTVKYSEAENSIIQSLDKAYAKYNASLQKENDLLTAKEAEWELLNTKLIVELKLSKHRSINATQKTNLQEHLQKINKLYTMDENFLTPLQFRTKQIKLIYSLISHLENINEQESLGRDDIGSLQERDAYIEKYKTRLDNVIETSQNTYNKLIRKAKHFYNSDWKSYEEHMLHIKKNMGSIKHFLDGKINMKNTKYAKDQIMRKIREMRHMSSILQHHLPIGQLTEIAAKKTDLITKIIDADVSGLLNNDVMTQINILAWQSGVSQISTNDKHCYAIVLNFIKNLFLKIIPVSQANLSTDINQLVQSSISKCNVINIDMTHKMLRCKLDQYKMTNKISVTDDKNCYIFSNYVITELLKKVILKNIADNKPIDIIDQISQLNMGILRQYSEQSTKLLFAIAWTIATDYPLKGKKVHLNAKNLQTAVKILTTFKFLIDSDDNLIKAIN